MKKLIFAFILIATYNYSNAQTANNDNSNNKKSFWSSSLSYSSNSAYLGRMDSTSLPLINPELGYYDKSGLYLNASFSFSTGNNKRFDNINLESGYNFKAGDNFEGAISATKYFYNVKSNSVKSQLKSSLDANADYDFSFISIQVGGEVLFSKKTDIVLNLQLYHLFYIDNSEKASITPTIATNSGTQNFYQAKKTINAGINNGKKVSNYNSFCVLDYELSLPIS